MDENSLARSNTDNTSHHSQKESSQLNKANFSIVTTKFTDQSSIITEDQYNSVELASNAEKALEEGNYLEANKLAFEAIKLDPKNIDAYRILTMVSIISDDKDISTTVAGMRELLRFSRFEYKDVIEAQRGNFYDAIKTRPYLKLLKSIGDHALNIRYKELEIRVFEEMIRLDNNDNEDARLRLASLYMQCIAKNKKDEIYFPNRTKKHLDRLFTSNVSANPRDKNLLFGPGYKNEFIFKWYLIFQKYMNKDKTWMNLVKQEVSNDPYFVQDVCNVLLYVDENRLPLEQKKMKDEKVKLIRPVAQRIHNFTFEVTVKFLGIYRYSNMIFEIVEEKALINFKEELEDYEKRSESYLNEARNLMKEKNYIKAIDCLTKAKNLYDLSNYPSFHVERTSIPFAIFSNRAQCFAALGMWYQARIDIRFALMKKNDLIHLYKLMPIIADAFGSKRMKNKFQKMYERAAKGLNEEEWKETAKTAIGMLGLRALIGERIGLSQEEIQHEIEIGSDDMFEPVCLQPNEYPLLPWLSPNDVETKVL